MANYFFLASLLPPLEIGHIPSIDFLEFKELLRQNLSKSDLKKVESVLRLVDLENMRALWLDEPFDLHGNVNREELKQAMVELMWPSLEQFEPRTFQFFTDYTDTKDRLKHFSQLLTRFLDDESRKESGFLKRYFAFEKDLRLVITGFRAKSLHRDISTELQYEDSQDPIVAQILAQKDSSTYEPPFEYEELKPIFEAYKAFPLELHKVLNDYRFQKIEMFCEDKPFSIDRILGYLVQLILVEKWLTLDEQQGIKIVDEIVKKI